MTEITVDQTLADELSTVKSPLYLSSPAGQVLGRFLPVDEPFSVKDLELDISEEELRRRSENWTGRPLSDLLKEWEKRK